MSLAMFAIAALLSAAPVAADAHAAAGHQIQMTQPCTHCRGLHASVAAEHPSSQPDRVETRRDNPHSTVAENDDVAVPSATNEAINAAETGNPYSVDFRYGNAEATFPGELAADALDALESGAPDYVKPARTAVVATVASSEQSRAPKCTCMASDARGPAAGGQR